MLVERRKVGNFCACKRQLHEARERQNACIVAEAEGGGDRGFASVKCCVQGIGIDDGVRFVEDILEDVLAEVGSVGFPDERACTEHAVPPGILRLPAGYLFFGGEQVDERFGGDLRFVFDGLQQWLVHSREEARDFENAVVEGTRVDVFGDVRGVVEEFFQERLRIHFLPEFVAFVRVFFCLRVFEFIPVERADEFHVALAGERLDFGFRLLGAEFAYEGCHAYDAAAARAGVCFYVWRDFRVFYALVVFDGYCAVVEDFREVFRHALCDALMLLYAHLCQVA